jgi:hypothetical protein
MRFFAICLKTTLINCHPRVSFLDLRRRKKEPHTRVLAGFLVLSGVKYLSEFISIERALVSIVKGANLPYFGKQSNIMPYSPREPKRKANQGFPGVSVITEGGNEPNLGLFPPRYCTRAGMVSSDIPGFR